VRHMTWLWPSLFDLSDEVVIWLGHHNDLVLALFVRFIG